MCGVATVCGALVFLTGCGGGQPEMPALPDAASQAPKLAELQQIPLGLEVAHAPNPVEAKTGGRSGYRYTWQFRTSLKTMRDPITITEFYSFSYSPDDEWVFANYTGAPFTNQDFASWYSCKDGELEPGVIYTDPQNWSGNDSGKGGRMMWVYIGTTPSGEKVRGQAEITKNDAK